jgi:hypothetical protein
MDEFKVNRDDLRREATHESVLERVRSAGLLTISPEMFERLYLNPKTAVSGPPQHIRESNTTVSLVNCSFNRATALTKPAAV